jgi:hypothetical protein
VIMSKASSVPAPAVHADEPTGQFRYVVFDEAGAISQVNRVFDRKGYPDVLHDNAVRFLELTDLKGVGGETHYVKGAALAQRPVIRAAVSKPRIKADNIDTAVIAPLPRAARVSVFRNGVLMPGCADMPLGDTSMEVTATQPGRYRVEVVAWPYQRAAFDIEAVE